MRQVIMGGAALQQLPLSSAQQAGGTPVKEPDHYVGGRRPLAAGGSMPVLLGRTDRAWKAHRQYGMMTGIDRHGFKLGLSKVIVVETISASYLAKPLPTARI